jgi:hypothetical protein
MVKTNKLRREAEECRQNAEQATNPSDRGSWLRLADDLMKLARTEDDLRIKIAGLNRLRDFIDKWEDSNFFPRARQRKYLQSRMYLQVLYGQVRPTSHVSRSNRHHNPVPRKS